jgi:aspartyl-tRNA(Asn)/glutamyl-tRNA(Gln) amidotransferase subunit B
VEKALHYEVNRQKEILLDGGQVVQETRLWNTEKNMTTSMRIKEEAHDYRYFPDPDLLPLVIDETWIEAVRTSLPELPDQKRKRFIEVYGLPPYDAGIITTSRELADYFEDCVKLFAKPKTVSNWVMGPLVGYLNATGLEIGQSPVSAAHLAQLLELVDSGEISSKIAKTVFEETANSGRSPRKIVAEKGLVQVSDAAVIREIVSNVLENCAAEVQDYQNGKTKLFGFFVGQVMKATKGQANPKLVNEILKEKLDR